MSISRAYRVVLVCWLSGCSAPVVTEKQAAPATLVLAEHEQTPVTLAIDDEFVYWVAGTALKRAALDGGDAKTLAKVSAVGALVAADGGVFFTAPPAGTVVRVDRNGSTHVIGHGVQPSGIAVRDGQVFWTNAGMTTGDGADGSIATVHTDGSAERVLLEGLSQPAAIAVDATHIYFSSSARSCSGTTPPAAPMPIAGCTGGGVSALPRAGGDPILIDGEATPAQLVLGAKAVFWMAGGPTRVFSAPLVGSGKSSSQMLAQSFDEHPGTIAVDDTALYFASAERGRVMKLPHTASELSPIAVDLGEKIADIAVDERGVYVAATSQGRILRFAKDGSAARATEPTQGPCPTPLGTADEIASTPRDDKNLEQLALHLDAERVVASQETYDRVVADVEAIRKLDMGLPAVPYFSHDDAQTLMLTMTDLAFQSVEAGTYSAWDCLTKFYGLVSQNTMTIFGRHYVELELDGNYNLPVLAKLFAKLPGVTEVTANSIGGDSPTLCARRVGQTIDYVVDRREDDCLAGCIEHHAKHVVSTAAGMIETRESWDSTVQSSRPDWFTQICPLR